MVAKRQANGVTDVGTARRQARTGSGGAQVVLHEPKVDGRNVVRAHRVRGRTAGPAPVPHAATPAARSLSSGQRHAQPARALERCLSMLRPAAPPSVPHPPRQPDHSNLSLPVLVTKSSQIHELSTCNRAMLSQEEALKQYEDGAAAGG